MFCLAGETNLLDDYIDCPCSRELSSDRPPSIAAFRHFPRFYVLAMS